MLKRIIGTIWRKLTPSLRRRVVRLTQTQFTVSAAAIIVNDAGEVLLLDHVLRPASGWGIPGGFLDRDESPEAAVRRELREETGIELTDVRLLRARTLDRHIEMLFTARTKDTPVVKSREINAARWFEPSEMPAKMSRTQKSDIESFLRDKL